MNRETPSSSNNQTYPTPVVSQHRAKGRLDLEHAIAEAGHPCSTKSEKPVYTNWRPYGNTGTKLGGGALKTFFRRPKINIKT